MDQIQSRTWIFPSYDNARIARNAFAAVKVAYQAVCRLTEPIPPSCTLINVVIDKQPALTFQWRPGVDARLPAIVEAIALLVGGSEVLQE
jgi:hypothetical protein